MKHFKQYYENSTEIMTIVRVFKSGESIVIYPNKSITSHSATELRSTEIPFTSQEYEIIKRVTIKHLDQ